jgi:hypothetical protein
MPDYSRMEWISFHGPRRPINGQEVYYFGEGLGGVFRGKYHFCPDDEFSQHNLSCSEGAGYCDRMDAPWWMPYLGQPKPQRPSSDYPPDYPGGQP